MKTHQNSSLCWNKRSFSILFGFLHLIYCPISRNQRENCAASFMEEKKKMKMIELLILFGYILLLSFNVYFWAVSATSWIDVCQSNGNLVASGGNDQLVKIFDKRESKIVRTFGGIHESNIFYLFNRSFLTCCYCLFLDLIYCVRWSSTGDMLASASNDTTAALLDFKTGKKIYTGKTSDGSKFSWFTQ